MAQGVRHEDAGRGRRRVLPVRRLLGGGGAAAALTADGPEATVPVVEARAGGGAGPALGRRQGRRGRGSPRRRWRSAEGDQEEGSPLGFRGREGQETAARPSS